MSDYEHSRYGRDYPHSAIDTGGSGLFWLLVVVATLGLLVLVVTLGSGSTLLDQPQGAGSEAIIVPTEPDASSAGTGAAIE